MGKKKIDAINATNPGISPRTAARKMSATFVTRRDTWPRTALTATRRPATGVTARDTSHWTVPAAREL